MNYIVSYQKVVSDGTTYQLIEPEDTICTELATIDGVTYVTIPEGASLPTQHPQVSISLDTPTMTPELINAIKAASPHCKLIAKRRIDKIREKYDVDDELFFARIAGGAGLNLYDITQEEQAELLEYKSHVEDIRTWGREQYAILGLVLPDEN